MAGRKLHQEEDVVTGGSVVTTSDNGFDINSPAGQQGIDITDAEAVKAKVQERLDDMRRQVAKTTKSYTFNTAWSHQVET